VEIIDGKKAVQESAAQAEPQQEAQPETGAQDEQEAPAPKAVAKQILIMLDENGMVSVRSTGICTVEFFGMMHEADRLTKQQIEIKEAMAMEAAMRQQQELEMVRAAIAHPAPQPQRK
jgi:hypothetical protein